MKESCITHTHNGTWVSTNNFSMQCLSDYTDSPCKDWFRLYKCSNYIIVCSNQRVCTRNDLHFIPIGEVKLCVEQCEMTALCGPVAIPEEHLKVRKPGVSFVVQQGFTVVCESIEAVTV